MNDDFIDGKGMRVKVFRFYNTDETKSSELTEFIQNKRIYDIQLSSSRYYDTVLILYF